MTQKTLALAVLFFFGVSLLEGLFAPAHNQAKAESNDQSKENKAIIIREDESSLDWVDELAAAIGLKKEWDAHSAKKIFDDLIKRDEDSLKKLEVQANTNAPGITGKISVGIDKIALAKAKSTLAYHMKLQKVLSELPDNKKDREHVVKHLIELDKNNKKLEKYEKEYKEAQGSQKAKLWPSVSLQRLKVNGKKKFIEALILRAALDF